MNQGNSRVCTTENNQDMEIAKEDRPFQIDMPWACSWKTSMKMAWYAAQTNIHELNTIMRPSVFKNWVKMHPKTPILTFKWPSLTYLLKAKATKQ